PTGRRRGLGRHRELNNYRPRPCNLRLRARQSPTQDLSATHLLPRPLEPTTLTSPRWPPPESLVDSPVVSRPPPISQRHARQQQPKSENAQREHVSTRHGQPVVRERVLPG